MGVHIILYLKVSDVTPLSPRQAPKAIIFLDQATCLLIVQMKLCLPFGCLFDRAPEVWFWSSGPRRDHWQERIPSRRKKEGEVGRNGKAQCEMLHCLMAGLLHFCLTNESLAFEWHHWSLPSSSSSSFLFPFSVCHPSPLPSIHYCQSFFSKKTS